MDEHGVGAPAAVRSWLTRQRPVGLVEQARWLFRLAPVAELLMIMPGMVYDATGPRRWLMLLGGAALVALWCHRYRLRAALLPFDAAEVAVTMMLAVLGPDTLIVVAFLLPGLWFRALYGSLARVGLFSVTMAVGLLVARWTPAVTAHSSLPLDVLPVIGSMFLTTGIARYVTNAIFVREGGRGRLVILAELGQHLIGSTARAAVWSATRDCVAGIARATPGLVIITGLDDGDDLTVINVHGDPAIVPTHLPRTVLPADHRTTGPVPDPAALAGVIRAGTAWVAIPPGGARDPWLFVGGPPRVVEEVVSVLESMISQTVLAMRTSQAHRDLTAAATCDPLTGLANRGAFTAALEGALGDAGRRVALMFLDLDDFKLGNDGLGHAAGDELLRQVSMRMRESVREDDLCARLGGDEFAVLLLDADDIALTVARRLVDRVANPVSLGGRIAQVGASVGLAFSGHDDSAEDLVQHADIAMYAAKAKGKNRVQVFDPSLLQDDGRDVFETELAASAAAGQLSVLYQPIISVADGRCHAVEALVRWQHPTRGLLGPAEFIPIAEHTGAIVDIGAFVLWTACADAAAWSRQHGRLVVHVNVSVAQLTDPNFEDNVRGCLETFAMEPQQLVLEITETMILDSADARAALQRLVALGAAIAIDDFGTGYSALSTLRMLPVSIVKIDRSFVSGEPSGDADEAIVEAVVQMAGRLGLHVIGEGVERLDQQQFLERVGVDAVQGYLHLRPTSAQRLGAWLDHQTASPASERSDVPGVIVLRRVTR